MRHLKQRGRQAVTIGHGGLLDWTPGFPGAHPAGDSAAELNLRFLSVTQCGEGVPHFMRTHFLRDLERTHIAGFLNHTLDRQRAIVVRVSDVEAANRITPRTGVDERLRRDTACFQRHGHGDRLHGRARLKGVRHSTVTQLLTREVFAFVGHVAGVIGQRQHFAGDSVKHHHTAALGFLCGHGLAQFLVGKKLHLAVQRELQVLAIDRRHFVADVFDHAAFTVFDDAPGARASEQVLLKSQLHAIEAGVFNVGKADHVRRGFAIRVLALESAVLVNAFETELGDALGHRLFDLALEPDKTLVFIAQLAAQLCERDLQQLRQLFELRRRGIDIFRNRPDAGRRNVGGQDQTIAVHDAATAGRKFQRADKAHLALTLKKCIAENLHMRRPGSQHGKPQRNGGHDELAAPHRRFAGQQGTGAVTYAAAHGFTGAGAAAESRKATYWVIAGVAGCICNFSLASLSTRMGVACARFSASALSLSISSLRICKAAFSSSTNNRRDSYWMCTR